MIEDLMQGGPRKRLLDDWQLHRGHRDSLAPRKQPGGMQR